MSVDLRPVNFEGEGWMDIEMVEEIDRFTDRWAYGSMNGGWRDRWMDS